MTKDPQITVSILLGKMSSHLDMLAGQIFDIEEELGALLATREKNVGISIAKFQSLDFARQSMEDCALLLQVLSDDPAASNTLETEKSDIEQKLKLDATRRLLSVDGFGLLGAASGEIDLF